MNETIAELHRWITAGELRQPAAAEVSRQLQGMAAVYRDTEHGRVCDVCGAGHFVDDDAERSHSAWHWTFLPST